MNMLINNFTHKNVYTEKIFRSKERKKKYYSDYVCLCVTFAQYFVCFFFCCCTSVHFIKTGPAATNNNTLKHPFFE